MPKVGTLTPTNLRFQSPRTVQKINENTDLLVKDVYRLLVQCSDEKAFREAAYNALSWTANDVLAQAVSDGYVSTQDGVLL
jgi:hypothetical protein